jgi:Copper transport outer membrane protein, MctB
VINFRYHLVSIAAAFLALAVGIVLGSTELQGPTYDFLNNTTAALQSELDDVSGQLDTAQAQAAVGGAYADVVEPVVLRDLLAGQRLMIITEPGAPAFVVTAISNAAGYAGGTVTGQIALQPKFFDTTGPALGSLKQVNVATAQTSHITLDSSKTYQQQAAHLLASECLTKSPGSPVVQQSGSQPAADAQSVLAAYAQSGFLTIGGQPATQATLAVIVTPQNAPPDGSSDPLGQLLVPLAGELAAKSAATVVAGSSSGSGPGSPIAVLRSSSMADQVSSVDDADLVVGQSVVIQALATRRDGGVLGSYGITANGATAVAPSPVPTPAASVRSASGGQGAKK